MYQALFEPLLSMVPRQPLYMELKPSYLGGTHDYIEGKLVL